MVPLIVPNVLQGWAGCLHSPPGSFSLCYSPVAKPQPTEHATVNCVDYLESTFLITTFCRFWRHPGIQAGCYVASSSSAQILALELLVSGRVRSSSCLTDLLDFHSFELRPSSRSVNSCIYLSISINFLFHGKSTVKNPNGLLLVPFQLATATKMLHNT